MSSVEVIVRETSGQVAMAPNTKSKRSPLGQRITEARRSQGLTQQALAMELGVSVRIVQMWESGFAVPRHGNLYALADKLGVSVADLYQQEAA